MEAPSKQHNRKNRRSDLRHRKPREESHQVFCYAVITLEDTRGWHHERAAYTCILPFSCPCPVVYLSAVPAPEIFPSMARHSTIVCRYLTCCGSLLRAMRS